MSAARNYGGRPGKRPKPGQRVHLGFRVTPTMKRRLEATASDTGRSISQEAEFRLEGSFQREDLLTDAMTLAYGQSTAGILMVLGEAMNAAGESALFILADGSWERARAQSWLDSAPAYQQAVRTAHTVLELIQPEAKTNDGAVVTKWDSKFWAEWFLKMAVTGEPNVKENTARAQRLNASFQSLASRVSSRLPKQEGRS